MYISELFKLKDELRADSLRIDIENGRLIVCAVRKHTGESLKIDIAEDYLRDAPVPQYELIRRKMLGVVYDDEECNADKTPWAKK